MSATTLPSRGAAQSMPPSLAVFLQQTIALSSDEMTASTSGKPVVKVLASADAREVATFGVVHISVPRSFYVQRAADFPVALRNPTRVRLGLFSDPAVPSDVAALSLPHDDIEDLAHCHPGACKVKLSSATMAQLRSDANAVSPSADSGINALFRERIIQYIADYRARGNQALVEYADNWASAAGQVFAAMLARSPYMYQYAPSLERYLVDYPKERPADLAEVLFWAEDDLPNLKSTLTMTHEIVYAPPELPGCTLIASKLLYADHYLDGALTLTAVVDAPGDQGAPGIYLVLLRRLHFDNLPSGGVMNVRGKATGKLREQTAAVLRDAKTRSEETSRVTAPLHADRVARRRRAFALVLALGLGLAVALTPYATGLIGIPVLYVAFAPAHGWLARRTGARVAAAVLIVLQVLVFVVLGGAFAGLIVNEARPIAANLSNSSMLTRLSDLRVGGVDVGAKLGDLGATLVSWIGSSAFGFLGTASRGALNLTISFFGLYYLLLRPAETWDAVRQFIPFSSRNTETLRVQFRQVTTSTLIGTGLSAAIQGLLLSLGFWVAGLPDAALWGLVAMVFGILPLLGSGLVWGPGAIVLLLDHRTTAAVLLAVWGLVVVGNVGQVIQPWASRRWGHIHPLVTLVGALVGVPYFGILGLLIGPLAVSYFFELITMYQEEYLTGS